MSDRRRMQIDDWISSAINLIIGMLFGLAANGLAQLATTGFWPVAVVILTLVALLLLFHRALDGLIDRMFRSGTMPAHEPRAEGRTPMARLLSIPAGIVLGVILARLGLTGTILGLARRIFGAL